MSNKKFKAIFGNPPYSIRKNRGVVNLLWTKFSESSIKNADEVYYITPYIWHGSNKKIISENEISKVDFTIADEFEIGSSICYWNTHESKKIIKTKDKVIEIDKLSDVEYIPSDVSNTLSIHMKAWDKNKLGIKASTKLHSHYSKRLLCRTARLDPCYNKKYINKESDNQFRYKVYHYNMNKLYYTNDEGISKYGQELFYSPKIIIGRSSDNTPFFDRQGEYATTDGAYYIKDNVMNLEIRYKQIQSKFTKFWFGTARQEIDTGKNQGLVYHAAFRLFPDIPLEITTDGEIYRYFDLTDEEVCVVEKYSDIATQGEYKRNIKYNKKETSNV